MVNSGTNCTEITNNIEARGTYIGSNLPVILLANLGLSKMSLATGLTHNKVTKRGKRKLQCRTNLEKVKAQCVCKITDGAELPTLEFINAEDFCEA